MANDAFGAALAGFRQWTKKAKGRLVGDPEQDVAEVRVVLDLMRDYLSIEGPSALTPDDLEDLLLRVYPRKITVTDAADTVYTLPAMSDFVVYLTEAGELTQARADELESALRAMAPRFGPAVMDPANWGMARSFVTMMTADGVDLGNEVEVKRWIADYNADLSAGFTDDDEDDVPGLGLKELFGLTDELPPIRLPADIELAASARLVPVIARLKSLAEWLGEDGREVGEDGDPLPDDVPAAAKAAGVDPGELPYVWDLAVESDFIFLDYDEEGEDGEDETTRAHRGELAEGWDGYDDTEVLDAWQMLLGITLLRTFEVAAEQDPDGARGLIFAGQGGALAVTLFLARTQGIQVADASGAVRESAIADLQPARGAKMWQAWTRAHGEPVRLLLGRLTDIGAVRITEDPDEGELIWLTPLGLYAIRIQLIDAGVNVPLLLDIENMTASDLLALSDGVPEEEFNAAAEDWLGFRKPEVAARELLSEAAHVDASLRLLAVAMTTELGAAAEPAWRDCLGELPLRGYAKSALAALAGNEMPGDLAFEDIAWICTDTLIGFGVTDPDDEHDPAELARVLGEAVPRGQEERLFEAMARLPHHEVAEVLTVLGRAHPDKKTAKLARKAAYKAGSRQANRIG